MLRLFASLLACAAFISLLLILTDTSYGKAYERKAHEHSAISCDTDVCTESSVEHNVNKNVKPNITYIYHSVCIFNEIKGKSIWKCEYSKGLPKQQP